MPDSARTEWQEWVTTADSDSPPSVDYMRRGAFGRRLLFAKTGGDEAPRDPEDVKLAMSVPATLPCRERSAA
jgi:hypothetical protein